MSSADMDDVARRMELLRLCTFEIGSTHWVYVTHINNPSSFYVRSTETFNPPYNVQYPFFRNRPDPSKLTPEAVVIFKSKLKNEFLRGKIALAQEVDNRVCYDIMAIDFGFVEKSIDIDRVYVPKNPFSAPPMAVHCQLANCKSIGEKWSKDSIDAMIFFIGEGRAKMNVTGTLPNQLIVELINTCPNDISLMLVFSGRAVLGCDANAISRFSEPIQEKLFFVHRTLSVGEKLRVRTQSGKSVNDFYVAQVDDYECYLRERNNLTYFSEKQKVLPIEDMKVDTIVAVFMECSQKYERGVIQQILVPETRAMVYLIDWGKLVDVHIVHLKVMPEKFYFYVPTALHCRVEDSQLQDHRNDKFLYPGCEYFITIKKLGISDFSGEVPHIVSLSEV